MEETLEDVLWRIAEGMEKMGAHPTAKFLKELAGKLTNAGYYSLSDFKEPSHEEA